MLQSDWLSYCTLSAAISEQSLEVAYKMVTLTCFLEVLEEGLETFHYFINHFQALAAVKLNNGASMPSIASG